MKTQTKRLIVKYLFRFLTAIFVFFFFKALADKSIEDLFGFNQQDFAYLIFSFTMVLGMWEVTDAVFYWVSSRAKSERGVMCLSVITQYLTICTIITLVVSPFIAYVDVYGVANWLKYDVGDFKVAYFQSCVGCLGLGAFMTANNLVHYFMRYEKKVEVFQQQLKQAEILSKYESLKNQINPHFLFNSFSVLTSLIYKDQDMAADFTTQLSKIYRYVLENKEKDLVSLKDEVKFIKSFFFLLKIRHKEAVNMDIGLDLRLDAYHVPPLALQMLVENAIKHNAISAEAPLQIDIYNDTEGFLVVQNNIQKRAVMPESTNVGLENIKERFALHTNEHVEVEVKNGNFVVRMPLLSGEQLNERFAAIGKVDLRKMLYFND